jgi:asparagine synthase (glutamine-hydrolysing)
MCGIAAAYRYGSRQPIDPGELATVCECMACRGPDGSGEWRTGDGRVALGHRRLSIIDLSAQGAQPMSTPDGSVVVVFNGEIYNYRELRSALEARGSRFRSTSDTEVLLHLYLEQGVEAFTQLRGMYALALWDARRQGLLLARDPFGIKPLYIANDGTTVRVASEVRALMRSGAIGGTPDPAGHVGFFLWGHVPEPHSMHTEVRVVPAGTTTWIDDRGVGAPRVFTDVRALLSEAARQPATVSQAEADDALRSAVRDSVRHHMVADVDVGVFLSAGIDSTTIASLAAESAGRLKTVTLGFAEFRGTQYDETPLAEQVARQIGSDHQTIWVSQSDFRHEHDRFLARMDLPTTDGLNSYFVARAASLAGVKVALSGLGGDELFAGYDSFRQVPRIARALGRIPFGASLGAAARKVAAPVVGRLTSPKYAGVLEYGTTIPRAFLLRRALYMPWELTEVLDRDFAREGLLQLGLDQRMADTVVGIPSERLQVTALETLWYMRNQLLRDSDWASMSHSVEVRVPFVDLALWKAALPLAANPSLRVDKQAVARSTSRPLPQALLDRPKTGFFVPTRDWLVGTQGQQYAGRRLRGWARYVYDHTVTPSSHLSAKATPQVERAASHA